MTRNKRRTVDLWVLVPSQKEISDPFLRCPSRREWSFFNDIHQSSINPILNLLPQVQISLVPRPWFPQLRVDYTTWLIPCPQGQILVLFHCLHSMHSLASVSSLPACFSAHTLSGIRFSLRHIYSLAPSCKAARALSLPGGRTLTSPAAGLFPPWWQYSFLPGGRTLSSPAAGLSPPRRQDSFLPGGRTLSSPAAGLFPPRRQDSFLPDGRPLSSRRQDSHLPDGRTLTGRTLSSLAAGLFPPRRQDSFLPDGRTLSSPAAGLFPPRWQDSFLSGGSILSSPAAGLFPPRRQNSWSRSFRSSSRNWNIFSNCSAAILSFL